MSHIGEALDERAECWVCKERWLWIRIISLLRFILRKHSYQVLHVGTAERHNTLSPSSAILSNSFLSTGLSSNTSVVLKKSEFKSNYVEMCITRFVRV